MHETIGQRLKREREARYLTLEQAAADTRIRTVFLQALEADDYSVMPSAAQGRGFLRNYAEYLDLNIDEMIAEIQRNAPPSEVSGPLPQVNLAETDLPPLTDTQDEKPASFLTRIFSRRPKADATPEAIQAPVEPAASEVESTPVEAVPDVVEETPKPRKGRKKKTVVTEEAQPFIETEIPPPAENPLEGVESLPVPEEARAGWMQRLQAIFKRQSKSPDSESIFKRQSKSPDSESILVTEEEETLEEKPPTPATPLLPADIIFAEIGVQLRQRRELISLTFEEVERHTHLRTVFVKALEEGAFDKLPSPVQTRGMLVNYATFLDLDVDAILLRFADALQARRREKYAETPREKIQTQVRPSMPFLRTFIASDLIFGLMMIVVLSALAIWGVGSVIRIQEEQVEPTAPSIVEVLGDASLPTASPEATFVAVEDPGLATSAAGGVEIPAVEATQPDFSANVTVSVFALERVFVRISVDGEIAFEGRLAPRETRVFEAEEQVVILTGDGSALRITYNGRDLGLMGGIGEVVSNVYTVAGVVTPTATIPPTPTNTPPVTPTFTPSSTPTPTATTASNQ
ncbi:MAG TPA: DUF4115 domain-containing protein [Anaerolineales bacterium]|nr:DUF4115 domain-containing protein [Anaerolineales bacterium]